MTIRVGCIGAGFIAGRHLGHLAMMPEVTVVGVADVDGRQAREYASRFGGRAYEDWRTMLERERPDAVYICLPPFARGQPEQALVEAGVPFFAEKPLGTTPDPPEQIARQVEASRLLTSVGYHWRYLDTMERAHELLRRHRPQLALGYWLDFVPPPPWWTRRELSGGQLVEQTTHIFDLVRYLIGEPCRVFAAACSGRLSRCPDGDIDTASVATLQFAAPVVGVIASTCVLHYPHRIGLWLYAEDMVLECRELSLTVERPRHRETREPEGDPFVLEDRAFIHAVRTGDQSGIRVPYAEALRTHRLVMRVIESARSGQPLELGDQGRLPA